jgi:hypothetical protein
MSQPKSCKDCFYWNNKNSDHPNFGHCLRFPPMVIWESATNDVESYYPKTRYDDYCGEYKCKD